MEHQQAIQNVLYAVSVFRNMKDKTSKEIISTFENDVGNEIQANKLYAFVPMAFGFALAKKMGVRKFPSEYIPLNRAQDKVRFSLGSEHIFTAALSLAFETLENGWSDCLSKDAYEAVIAHSAEIDALNRALNAGEDIGNSEFNPSTVYGVFAEQNSV